MRRPSPAFVVAVLALAVALGGTAVAAKRYVITSTKQISPSVLRQLRGATGTGGPAGLTGVRGQDGAAGAPGAPGAPGVTSVVTATGGPVTLHPTANVGRAVATLQPLPEGSWLVVGTADVAGAGEPGEQVRCSILAGGAEQPGSSVGGEHVQVTATAPLVLTGPADVSLLCRHNGGGATLPSLDGARLYAIRTAELDRRG